MRSDCEVYVEINLIHAHHNDIKFLLSKNKVILSPGIDGIIPYKYFKRVCDNNGKCLHMQDYEIGFVMNDNNVLTVDLVEMKIIESRQLKDLNEFVETIEKTLFKRPCILIITNEEEYVKMISENQSELKYPAFYYDYILLVELNKEDILKGLIMFKNKLNSQNIKSINQQKRTKNESEVSNSKTNENFKLTKDTLLNTKYKKNYFLFFLNFIENDIIESIDCIIIPDSDITKFESFQFTIETITIKKNIENFLKDLKDFLKKNVYLYFIRMYLINL